MQLLCDSCKEALEEADAAATMAAAARAAADAVSAAAARAAAADEAASDEVVAAEAAADEAAAERKRRMPRVASLLCQLHALAPVCSEVRALVVQVVHCDRLGRVKSCPEWQAAWKAAVCSWRACQSPSAELCETDEEHTQAAVARLARLGSGNRARFWGEFGAIVAARNGGQRTLAVADRDIKGAADAAGRPDAGRKFTRASSARDEEARRRSGYAQLQAELESADKGERMAAFRAVRHMLAKYDGWK